MSNPEREWGLPSWPTRGDKGSVRDAGSSGNSGGSFKALALVVVGTPMTVLLLLVGYLVHGNLTQ